MIRLFSKEAMTVVSIHAYVYGHMKKTNLALDDLRHLNFHSCVFESKLVASMVVAHLRCSVRFHSEWTWFFLISLHRMSECHILLRESHHPFDWLYLCIKWGYVCGRCTKKTTCVAD